MGSIRSKLIIVAVAAVLTLGAAAQAGLMPPDVSVVQGAISSFDAATGQLVMAGRTLYLTAQSVVQKRVDEGFEAVGRTQLYPGREAKAVIQLTEGRYVVRSLELIEKKEKPAQ
jgi:hypothetical protein